MKSPFALLAAAVVALAGCGGEAENMSAQYPAGSIEQGPQGAPVGTDAEPAAPAEGVAASEMPGMQSPAPAMGGNETYGTAYAQPEATDIQVGADGSAYTDTDPSALTDFHQTLDPYGTWVDDGTYGTVWVPSSAVVGADFAPYVTSGHWAYDDDYVWVSDYDWGWAPFHYGRWVYIGGRGWSWIPGRTYAGAWVTWRYGWDDWAYVGWAPMPPEWYWRGGYAVGIAVVPPAPYVFCHSSYLFAGEGVHGHIVTGGQVPIVASHTRPYTPASPTVGGGVVGGGHVGAHPTVGGPPPQMLGLNPAQVPHAPQQNVGLLHAQQFARPSTAQALGARAPTLGARAGTSAQMATPQARAYGGAPYAPGGGGAPHYAQGAASYGGGYGAYGAQHGGTTTLGRNAPVASAPQYRGVQPTPYRAPSYSAPRYAAPSYSAPHYSAPSYSAPSYSAPRYAAPSYGAPRYAAPSYSAPHAAAPSYSAPHYSAPSGSFHSGSVAHPSSGGFHGGGARGGRR